MLPYLKTFNGGDTAEYLAWRVFLVVKYKTNRASIGEDTEMVWYRFGYLEGEASSCIFPWIASQEQRQIPLRVESFLAQLDAAFADPQRT